MLEGDSCILVKFLAENREGYLWLIQIRLSQRPTPAPEDFLFQLIAVFARFQIGWLQLASEQGQPHFLGKFEQVRQLLFELLLVNMALRENNLHEFAVAVEHNLDGVLFQLAHVPLVPYFYFRLAVLLLLLLYQGRFTRS